MKNQLLNHWWGLALLLSIIQLAAASPGYAQGAEQTITGTVTDQENGEGLPGVNFPY